MTAKIGVVLVSYNASTAVRVTLASLRAAHNDAPYEMVLVDNASRDEERGLIRDAMQVHVAAIGSAWTRIQESENLGFSGGNNVGIKHFLNDPSITHICLLNSDVIVTDGWLDGMLAADCSIISAVTNKAESEQCVPIDYEIDLDRALGEGEFLAPGVLEVVNAFAEKRRKAFAGSLVDADATFFCVMMTREVIEQVGLLDETFFPGGFEDDDYCIRARQSGHAVHVARDVFLHHWGSASFGKLSFDYFSSNAERNRSYLETKHGITWRRRYEKPLVSFAQDATQAADSRGADGERGDQRSLLDLHAQQLKQMLGHYQHEHANLYASVQRVDALRGHCTAELAQRAACGERLMSIGRPLLADAQSGGVDDAWQARMDAFAADVHGVVESSFTMHALLSDLDKQDAKPSMSMIRRLWSLVRHGVPFVLKLRGIVFLAGYPYAAREKDGYFQRIRVVDGMFDDRWRIYFDPDPLPGQGHWYDMPAQRTLVLRGGVGASWKRRLWVKTLVWLLAIRVRRIYFHSVLRMHDYAFGKLLRLPFTCRILDVHGVVPEEFRMHNDFFSACLFDRHEERAARSATGMVVVTESMRSYMQQKYGKRLRAELIVLPIFPGLEPVTCDRPYREGRPIVVYAGGLHKWQQVPVMIDAIERTYQACDHRFYCTDPEAVRGMLSDECLASGHVVVDSKSHRELLQCYAECHFGLLLRADSVVNNVACPTKVVEYLALGIVPIMDCEDVGDFAALGMQFVPLRDFVAGRMPGEAERQHMAAKNSDVYGRLRAQRESGAASLRRVVGRGTSVDSLATRVLWKVAKLLPPDTVRGNAARWAYRALRRQPKVPPVPVASLPGVRVPDAEPCDVLVQVDHFNAGGLENVVLDLNVAFREAGLRVGMLVLVEAGEAVERARQQGVHVVVAPYSDATYRHCLATASPKVVISHYSMSGAAVCTEVGIPLVQVIHNTYMWLDAGQREQLEQTIPHTTLFVAVSEYVRDYSMRRLGLPPEKCRVIANGIDVARYRPSGEAAGNRSDRSRLRQQWGIADDAFVFLSVGSVNHQKNHLSLIKAFALCARDCPKAHLIVIGPLHEAELVHKCRAHIEQQGLEHRVTLAGGVSDAHRYYAMADCYAHSAFFEGGQLSMLEALAADLPIVTTEIGFAIHFKQCPGVRVVPAHFDIAEYEGHITAMKSSPATERMMAEAMCELYREPVRPGLSPVEVQSFDRSNAYQTYVEMVRGLMAGQASTLQMIERRSWARNIAGIV